MTAPGRDRFAAAVEAIADQVIAYHDTRKSHDASITRRVLRRVLACDAMAEHPDLDYSDHHRMYTQAEQEALAQARQRRLEVLDTEAARRDELRARAR